MENQKDHASKNDMMEKFALIKESVDSEFHSIASILLGFVIVRTNYPKIRCFCTTTGGVVCMTMQFGTRNSGFRLEVVHPKETPRDQYDILFRYHLTQKFEFPKECAEIVCALDSCLRLLNKTLPPKEVTYSATEKVLQEYMDDSFWKGYDAGVKDYRNEQEKNLLTSKSSVRKLRGVSNPLFV